MRIVLRILALLLFAVAVYGGTATWVTRDDLHFALLAHSCVYLSFLLVGELVALSYAKQMQMTVITLVEILLPKASDKKIIDISHKFSVGVILLGIIPVLLWTSSRLNVFIDLHIWFLVEIDVALVLMGFITGIAWIVVLRTRAYLSLLLTIAMVLMVVGNVLSKNSW